MKEKNNMPGSENSIGPAKRGGYQNKLLLGKFNNNTN